MKLVKRLKRATETKQGSGNTSDPVATDASPTPLTVDDGVEAVEEDPKAEGSEYPSRLESLPPELRSHLLSTLDLPGLKALVHASPTFHRQYLHDSRHLLGKGLQETLGSAIVDANAVRCCTIQRVNTEQDLIGFLKSYSEQTSLRCLPRADTLTQDEVVGMVALYFRFVKPFVEYYAQWLLQNLATETGKEPHAIRQQALPSRIETIRLTRAIYRFQLLCQLKGLAIVVDRIPQGAPLSAFLGVPLYAPLSAFLDALEPWEIEELFSFYEFTRIAYGRTFNNISSDLHPDNPRFESQGRPPTPLGAFELDSYHRNSYLEGTILHGLTLLHTALFGTQSHDDLVSIMQQHITASYVSSNAVLGVVSSANQEWKESYSSGRNGMREQVPLPFRGDGEPDAPPLAWTLIWKNTYSCLYGWDTSDELRRWGYVFWDAATLKDTGGQEVVERQWYDYWGGVDPREE